MEHQPALPPAPTAGPDDEPEYADHSPFFHSLCKVVCGTCPDCNSPSLECEAIEFGARIGEDLTGHDYRCSDEYCSFTRRVNDETVVMAAEWATQSSAWQYYPPSPPEPEAFRGV